MTIRHFSGGLLALLAVAAFAVPAYADAKLFRTEEQAQQACGSSAVVWVDVNKERYYPQSADAYGKGNGGYTCEKDAGSKYRPGK